MCQDMKASVPRPTGQWEAQRRDSSSLDLWVLVPHTNESPTQARSRLDIVGGMISGPGPKNKPPLDIRGHGSAQPVKSSSASLQSVCALISHQRDIREAGRPDPAAAMLPPQPSFPPWILRKQQLW